MDAYTVRIADSVLIRHLEAWPAEFITGPRAVGKTTNALTVHYGDRIADHIK